MSRRQRQLAARREVLCAQSARLRSELADDADALGVRFRIADRLVAVARSDAGKMLLAGAAVLVFFGRPRHILRLALKALALWPLVAPLLPHVKRFFGERERDAASAAP
jgi:hypothetical protein